MPKVRWVVSYGFCSKFHTLSSSANILKIALRFDKVTESSQVGTFFETQCIFILAVLDFGDFGLSLWCSLFGSFEV